MTVTVSDQHTISLERSKDPVTGDVFVGERRLAARKLKPIPNQSRNTDLVQSLATVSTPNPP